MIVHQSRRAVLAFGIDHCLLLRHPYTTKPSSGEIGAVWRAPSVACGIQESNSRHVNLLNSLDASSSLLTPRLREAFYHRSVVVVVVVVVLVVVVVGLCLVVWWFFFFVETIGKVKCNMQGVQEQHGHVRSAEGRSARLPHPQHPPVPPPEKIQRPASVSVPSNTQRFQCGELHRGERRVARHVMKSS